MKKLLLGLILLVIIVLLATNAIADNAATALQAQAAIEAGRAARTASLGSLIGMVLLGIVLVVSWAIILVLVVLRVRDQRQGAGRWVSGPNARWGKVENPKMGMLPPGEYPKLGSGDSLDQLVKLETLRMLRGMHQEEKTANPVQYVRDEDEIRW